MGAVRLLVLGVGDAFSARSYSSCLAVETEGVWLLIDCPHPIRKMMHEASIAAGIAFDVGDVAALVLTHLHADHASGVEGIAFFARYMLDRRLPLLAHPDVLADLWPRHLAGAMELSRQTDGSITQRSLIDFVEPQPLTMDAPVTLGPFTIHGRCTQHSIPSIAVKVSACGRTLGYSSDTTYDPALLDWLAECDLIIHEAGVGRMHTPYERLVELPADLRARLRLIHYPDYFDTAASAIPVLRQGGLYTI